MTIRVLSLILLGLATTGIGFLRTAQAQVPALEKGSIGAFRAEAEHRMRGMIEAQRRQKLLAMGQSLFGRSPDWSDDEGAPYAGTLHAKSPSDWVVGDWGCSLASFKVLDKVGPMECLAVAGENDDVVLIRGLDTSKVRDGAEFMLLYPVTIDGTHDYNAVGGSSDTVLALNADATAAKAAANASQFRTWTDTTGTFSIRAKFVRFRNKKVTLEKEDGTTVDVPLAKLDSVNRQFATQEHEKQQAKK